MANCLYLHDSNIKFDFMNYAFAKLALRGCEALINPHLLNKEVDDIGTWCMYVALGTWNLSSLFKL